MAFFESWFTAIIYLWFLLCICLKIPIYLRKQLFQKRKGLEYSDLWNSALVHGDDISLQDSVFMLLIVGVCIFWQETGWVFFSSLSQIKTGSFYIPASSSLLFRCLRFTLPLRLCLILFTHMFSWIFRSFIIDPTMHSWSSSRLEVLTMTVSALWVSLCRCICSVLKVQISMP